MIDFNSNQHKETAKHYADMIKNGHHEQAMHDMAYLTGLYGVYYGIAALTLLSEEDGKKFIASLCAKCDPPKTA